MTSLDASDTYVDLAVAGLLRDKRGTWRRGEVLVRDQRIVAVLDDAIASSGRDRPYARRRIDVGQSFILPGAVDSHVHCLSYEGEGVLAATSAAAVGGVTTIVEMPFDAAGPINSVDRLRAKQDLVNDEAVVDVALLATLRPGGGWRDADALAAGGAVGFKVSLFDTHPSRFPRTDDADLVDVMRAVHACGQTLCVHAENNEIVQARLAHESALHPLDPGAHSRSRPPVSETIGVLTALEVAANTEASVHLCHLSLSRSVDIVGWYQGQGADVSLETCPHYLVFTEEDTGIRSGRLKVNPPLRTPADRQGLWQRLSDGAITIVSSDHAPWPAALKDDQAVFANHSGVPGVETLVAITLGRALSQDPTLRTFERAVEALTAAPARRFGLADRKGSIAVGLDADLMVFRPDTLNEADAVDPWRIDGHALRSNAGWSPYDRFIPGGQVTLTVARGEVVWDAGRGLAVTPGCGQVLSRGVRR